MTALPAVDPMDLVRRRLTDLLVEDILATPDAEILAEIVEAGGDPDAIAADMQRQFERIFSAPRKDTPC